MPSLCSLLMLLVSLRVSEAAVHFAYSTLYGIYDFQRESEIPLPQCDSGCLIFVSTGGIYLNADDGINPYHKNLVVYDPVKDKNQSLTDYAKKWQKNSQKVPLELTENGTYSIMNLNDVDTDNATDITVWVVERSRALEISYEIYDAVQMSRTPAVPSSDVTIMSAQPFRVTAQPGEDNSFTARLVGFDNAFDDNPDDCVVVAEKPVGSEFDGFDFFINGPLISLVFNNTNKVALSASYRFGAERSITKDAFITSPGYVGCARLGDEYHHAKGTYPSMVIFLKGEDYYDVKLNAVLTLGDGREIIMIDMTNIYARTVKGNQTDANERFPITQFLAIQYGRVAYPESFLIRYNSSFVKAAQTDPPTTTTVTTPCPVYRTPSTTTSTQTPPTTSAAGSIAGFIAAASMLLRLQ